MVVEKAFKTRYTHEHQKKHPQRLAGAVKPNAAQPNNQNQSDRKYKSISDTLFAASIMNNFWVILSNQNGW